MHYRMIERKINKDIKRKKKERERWTERKGKRGTIESRFRHKLQG